MLKWFDTYVRAGLKPIPIYKNYKCPIEKGWNKNWSIDRWRHYFDNNPKSYNMGIILGEIIDVEGDSKEANDLLLNLIGDVPHPMFSSSKSIHHLFLTPDINLTRWTHDQIEFRGSLHQSVVPPSGHNDGTQYKWLKTSSPIIPHLPDSLLQFYLINRKSRPQPLNLDNECKLDTEKREKTKIKPGYTLTECKTCKNMFYIHRKRLILEVRAFKKYQSLWSCHKCRKIDVREDCRTIRNNDRKIKIPM